MPEPKIISGYEHSYAHKNPERYAYMGKEDGEPNWVDWVLLKQETRTSSQNKSIFESIWTYLTQN